MKRISLILKTTLLLCVVFSCKDNFQEIQKINLFDVLPVGITEDMKMIYSDSAVVKAILSSPKNIDYTNQSFPYSEFPEGLSLVFYDDLGHETHVEADYGILYNSTELVDLQGNVKITNSEGAILETQQLFWNINKEWLFTEKNFTFANESYDITAQKLDASRFFDQLVTGKLVGNVQIEEKL